TPPLRSTPPALFPYTTLFRSPLHDPLDAALGRGGGDPGAAALPDGSERDRADRHHPADRDREEERDHDDRLRARGGADGGEGAGGGDLRGLPAALPPDHDDHHGGLAGSPAAGARYRDGGRAAPPARHHHRGRARREPAAHPLHHPRRIPLPRPPAPVVRALAGEGGPVYGPSVAGGPVLGSLRLLADTAVQEAVERMPIVEKDPWREQY